jgi:hypothetical protein
MEVEEVAGGAGETQPEKKKGGLPKAVADRGAFMEELVAKVDVGRAQEMGVNPEQFGHDSETVSKAAQQIQEAGGVVSPPGDEEGKAALEGQKPPEQKTEKRRSLEDAKLSFLESHEDIPQETLDAVERAKSHKELESLVKAMGAPTPPQTPKPGWSDDLETEIVVDGKTQKITGKELRERAQKAAAADARLQEASLSLKEVQQLREDLKREREALRAEREKPSGTPPPETPSKPAGEAAPSFKLDQQKVQGWHQAMLYGTEEEGQKAIADLSEAIWKAARTAPENQGLSEATVRQMVQQETYANVQSAAIQKRFQEPEDDGGYADLAKNPDHIRLVADEANRMAAVEGADLLDWETYRKAGDKVRSILRAYPGNSDGSSRSGDRPPEDSAAVSEKVRKAIEDRRRRKESLDVVTGVQARSASAAHTEPMTEEQARAQALIEVARARGQSIVTAGR